MIKAFRGASIWSEDLTKLLPFYRDTLGLPVAMETEGFVILGDQSTPTLALGTHSEVHGPSKEPQRHMVALDSDDVAGDAARLKSKGVEFVEEPNKFDGGWITTFKDPEGNYVQLLQFS